jgi:hypothetical protein
LRTTLRRAVPSFTVEVRRRSRLATTSNPDAPSFETKSPLAAFDRNSHRAVAAAFDEKIVDRSSVDVGASPPRGRILPSLVPDAPRHRLLEDSPVPAADSEPSSRARKRGAQASKSSRNSNYSSDESAPLAEGLAAASRRTSLVQSDERAGASPGETARAPSQVVGDSRGLALRTKAKRNDKIVVSRDHVSAKPLPGDQRSAIGTDSSATFPTRVDGQSPEGRKRTIMARYVFGDELKPGERWKRRLLTSR